ncbi:UDP-glucose 4-epimerase [Gordonia malaquae]|jgi:UDP-glucose 4-epimerase|uniref:UDP-glucose 4-epimerase n=1 Tax=Gordonia malaquae NBRC 108250 TaxID=1223542 RepID=M3TK00_GORML|nr:UDP-glucose 4-epimerase GalE [Gordonia malaquae]GAC81801.1 UDP-glucose 4-epimerase [Gordonia malaquae NBRC 108250]SEB70720.1 UDP-glucose 4-epimerase [Gordonia malaquae]
MRVLVTGGAGYIGSHTVLQLLAAGHDVVIADDFSNAKPSIISRLVSLSGKPVTVYTVDLTDEEATDGLFASEDIDAVIHFAGFKAVGESVAKPISYYRNNIDTALSVLQAMDRHGVRTFVFSSSATVYGENPICERTEDMPTSATNPYGWTKVMIEQILRDVAVADDSWRIALLRYFNPVGAHPSGEIGEDPNGLPNNLMPFVSQVAVGRREKLSVFGDDYDTPDGTGVRDYIHVEDLASGHLAALDTIAAGDDPLSVWNLGSGSAVSVLDVVNAFSRASGRDIPYEIVPRRPGDLPAYWADPSKANDELGWKAIRTIDDMCADTWRWQSKNPNGFPDA